MVIDGNPFMTHGTYGVPALVTLVGNNRVLGLRLEADFPRLTLVGDHMMAFTIGTVKLAVTQGAIIRGSATTHIIPTVKAPASKAAVPLAGMIGAIVGVEPPFTLQTIIRTVYKGRKRGATMKMMTGFQ